MPMVPCPAITSGSSYGCTKVEAAARVLQAPRLPYASLYESPCSTTSRAARRHRADLDAAAW